MTARDFATALASSVPLERIQRNAPIAPLTTFKVGGPADWLVLAQRTSEVKAALAAAHGGDARSVDERTVRADGGLTINGLVRWTINRGVAGLEAWAGTPGTVGGAIYGNAHFKGRLIAELVDSVEVVDPSGDSGHEVRIAAADMEFGYDRSRLQRTRELLRNCVERRLS